VNRTRWRWCYPAFVVANVKGEGHRRGLSRSLAKRLDLMGRGCARAERAELAAVARNARRLARRWRMAWRVVRLVTLRRQSDVQKASRRRLALRPVPYYVPAADRDLLDCGRVIDPADRRRFAVPLGGACLRCEAPLFALSRIYCDWGTLCSVARLGPPS